MDRAKALQYAVVALLGILFGNVGLDLLPGTVAAPAAACTPDEGWKATVDAHIRTVEAQLPGMAYDIRQIRESLAELKGRGGGR